MLKIFISLCVASVIGMLAQSCQAIGLAVHDRQAVKTSGTVVYVLSGDLIDVKFGDEIARVRFIGVTSPVGAQCGAREAQAYASQLLQGQSVTLETDPFAPNADLRHNLWRYVWANGRLVNLLLIQVGYGMYSQEIPFQAQAQFQQAQQDAWAQQRGVWDASFCTSQVPQHETLAPGTVYVTPAPVYVTPEPVWPEEFILGVGFPLFHDRHDRWEREHGERHDWQNHIPQIHVPPNHVPPNHLPPNHVPQNYIQPNPVPQNHIPQSHVPQNHAPDNHGCPGPFCVQPDGGSHHR